MLYTNQDFNKLIHQHLGVIILNRRPLYEVAVYRLQVVITPSRSEGIPKFYGGSRSQCPARGQAYLLADLPKTEWTDRKF